MNLQYPNLFKPIEVGTTIFRNRIFGGPHYSGIPYAPPGNETAIETLAEEARGGAAKVTVNDVMVDGKYGLQPWAPFCFDVSTSAYFGECAAAIKQYGAKAFVEFDHAGQFAAVPNPIGPMDLALPDGRHVTAMDEELMQHVIGCFVNGCVLAKKAGYDGVMLHGGHGWLLDQFTSPYFNQRTDEYGGSVENRARFPKRLVKAIREAVGKDFVIEYRVSGDEHVEGGLTPDITAQFILEIEEYIDIVNISGGLECSTEGTMYSIPTIFQPLGINVEAASIIKPLVHIPVGVVGSINSPEMAEEIIASGKADCVTMTRELMADPQLPNKARLGQGDDIVPCMRCGCCIGESETTHTFACSANPTLLRTYRLNHEYAQKPTSRRVLVIGGGVGGMKAAITAAERGHTVILAEASDRLGGTVNFTDHDSIKIELNRHKNYLIHQVEKHAVQVLLNTRVTAENVDSFGAEAIIIAVGSDPVKPRIPGIDGENVMQILEMYENREKLGKRVVIIGGGMAGCETAMELARDGYEVTVLEALKGFARDAHRTASLSLLVENNQHPNLHSFDQTTVTAITEKGVEAKDKDGNPVFYEADSVVYAVGLRSRKDLTLQLYASAPYVVSIGDCVKPRRTMEAIREGYFAAMNIQ